MAGQRKSGAGRRPKSATGVKSSAFSIRLDPVLRKLIEAEAEVMQVPMSQVIEERLSQAFQLPGQHLAIYMLGIRLIEEIEAVTGKSFTDDRYTAEAVSAGLRALLLQLSPKRNAEVPDAVKKYMRSALAWMVRPTPDKKRQERLNEMLADEVEHVSHPDEFGRYVANRLSHWVGEQNEETPLGKALSELSRSGSRRT